MLKPQYRGLNVCHRDPEIVSNAHLILAEPNAVKLLAYTTDDLKMKKKESTNTVTSRQVVKEMYSEANVTVLCVYS